MTHTHHAHTVNHTDELAPRSTGQAMWRGTQLKCPNCGEGHLYSSYLRVADKCDHCGEELSHQRADDAPAYFTISIVAHIVGAGALILEQTVAPPTWVHMVLWLPLTVLLCLGLLPSVKGSLIGIQWAQRMHGFGGKDDVPEPDPAAMVAVEGGAKR